MTLPLSYFCTLAKDRWGRMIDYGILFEGDDVLLGADRMRDEWWHHHHVVAFSVLQYMF